jgi:hypothetical protein
MISNRPSILIAGGDIVMRDVRERRVFCLTESDIGDPIESSTLSAILPGCHVPRRL